ncbi:MAG: hypothetical protein GY755_22905 [Chloroflexi bacterium]|nr:hypothetical protein [Chloroflexota bacterium]
MIKNITKVFLLAFSITLTLSLFLFVYTYLDLYPKSYDIQIKKPGVGKYVANGSTVIPSGHKICETLSWGIEAQTNEKLRVVQNYYRERFDEYAYYPDVNTFTVYAINGEKYGVSVVKYIWFFTPKTSPFAYEVSTHIDFCRF